ncbi:CYTH domain-containing protein [Neobacillus cucumis]|uniref:CYTH domain-containing protein n=1 Tax=Neobacillus cucumis TaxID=1740721 RepID=A0A2N5HBN0_9BACI|nr:CYTH domain-containing protein [Neobacillus cucumis]PLS02918.1 CYTH domain-containing protein [Neobacillus cucumis]
MTQNIEIEFKNMLTKAEYERILSEFNIVENQIITQENFYFDTPAFALKKAKSALRIRKIGMNYMMTLKQPREIGLLETNQVLTSEEASEATNKGRLPNGQIKQLIEQIHIPFASIEYFGSLITNRVEFPYKDGILVLDHSLYLQKEDYEMEYEVVNYQEGLKNFQTLLEQFGIPERRTENKVHRFYNQKYRQSKTF